MSYWRASLELRSDHFELNVKRVRNNRCLRRSDPASAGEWRPTVTSEHAVPRRRAKSRAGAVHRPTCLLPVKTSLAPRWNQSRVHQDSRGCPAPNAVLGKRTPRPGGRLPSRPGTRRTGGGPAAGAGPTPAPRPPTPGRLRLRARAAPEERFNAPLGHAQQNAPPHHAPPHPV